MIRPSGIVAAGIIAGGAVVLGSQPARADWPMSRHDAQRTAAARGKSNIVKPQPTWRFPMGGALYYTQQLVGDADGDLSPEFFFVRGSAAVAKRLDDTTLWHTPSIGISSMYALTDLDGDDKPELVVHVGTNQAAVLDALTGAVRWTLPATSLYAASAVLVGDLDGDGAAEVLVQDCGCCGGTGDIPGAVFSFAGDVTSPEVLWNLPYASCGGSNLTTLVDVDDDGKLEVLLGRDGGFDLLDGATGTPRASLQYGSGMQAAQCVPARIGFVGEDVVCVLANGTSDDSGHRAFMLRFSAAGPTPTLNVIWDKKLGVTDGQIALRPGMVSDLDNDGTMELVIPAATGPGTWSTFVLDANTGLELTQIAGKKALGTAPVITGGRGLIFTEEPDGFTAYRFSHVPVPAVAQVFSMSGQSPLSFRDFSLSMRAFPKLGLLALDLTGDGTPDLITGGADGSTHVYDTSAGKIAAPPLAASAPGLPPASRLFSAPTTLGGAPVMVSEWSDGLFRVHRIEGAALVNAAPPGVAFGGAYTASGWRGLSLGPVIASLGPGEADSVVVTDASGTMHVLDASKATAAVAPVEPALALAPAVMATADASAPNSNSPSVKVFSALASSKNTIWLKPWPPSWKPIDSWVIDTVPIALPFS